ncbi:hypothetical protein H2200_013013 [Cladophialophora chaetospira]|uniref:Uncharacterized protein n=1 Tax=Cladophialophora chaetospira TaxID=386627 RepID=A0AA38WWJ8_9EURO|nr:hypothetical protein H2200_013013 [Cladophialophora chaetospira]
MTRVSTEPAGSSEHVAVVRPSRKHMARRGAPEAEEDAIIQLRRIEVQEEDWDHARNCGGIQLYLKGMSSIYIGFNREDIGHGEDLRVCEIFLGMSLTLIHVRPYIDGEPSNMGEIHRFETDGELVTMQDATHAVTGRDIVVVVDDTWYKVQISKDDKVLCLDQTVEGDEVPRLCGYKCLDGKDHHYYVRLRKEWRIPPMRKVDKPHRLASYVMGIDDSSAIEAFNRLCCL